jgi:hypothetical protein
VNTTKADYSELYRPANTDLAHLRDGLPLPVKSGVTTGPRRPQAWQVNRGSRSDNQYSPHGQVQLKVSARPRQLAVSFVCECMSPFGPKGDIGAANRDRTLCIRR